MSYILLRANINDSETLISGLNENEVQLVKTKFVVESSFIKAAPIDVINMFSNIGYKVVASSGDCASTTWTMERNLEAFWNLEVTHQNV